MADILLALQINNWNQNRKEENTIKEYAVSLIHDIEEDLLKTYLKMRTDHELPELIDEV